MNTGGWGGYVRAGACFADIVLHSSKNYHQELVTEPRRLLTYFLAAWGAVMLRFYGEFFYLYK
jgi:hypothetical protein